MPAARFWRIVGIETFAGGDLELSEVALYESAIRVDGSATVSSAFAPVSGALGDLGDADFGTGVRWDGEDVRRSGFAIVFDFGAGVTKDVTNVGFAGPSQAAFTHKVEVQASSDGVDWLTVFATPVASKWPGASAFFNLDAEFTKIEFPGFVSLVGTSWGAFEFVSETKATRLPTDGASLPNGVQVFGLSPDGNTVITRSLNYPWTDVFRRVGKSFFRQPTRPADPDSAPNFLEFSPDGTHLAVGHGGASRVNIYQHVDGIFTKLANITSPPSFAIQAGKYSPDGQHLAVAGSGGVAVYKRTGDTYAPVSGGIDVQPTGLSANHMAYSQDGLLAVGFSGQSTAAFWVYERSGDAYTKVAGIPLFNEDCRGVAFSPDGSKFASTGYVYNATVHLYARSGVGGKTFTEVFSTFSFTQWGRVAFSPSGAYLLSDSGTNVANGAIFKVNASSLTQLLSASDLGTHISAGTWLLPVQPSPGLVETNYDATPLRSGTSAIPTLIGEDIVGETQPFLRTPPSQQDREDGGAGYIVGTVKEKNTPANTPLKRRVVLLSMPGSRAIRETWSDPDTGAYEFTGVATDRVYTVVSYDHTGIYRGVVADNLTPEVMP